MQKILLIDPEKCSGCRRCESVCSLVKENIFSPAKARIGLMRITELEIDVPVVCQQCDKPLCRDVCPTGAISRNEETGAMVIDSNACIGCLMCLVVCPFGGISLDRETRIPFKCDLCGGDPVCVRSCEYGALQFLVADRATFIKRKAGVQKLSKILEKIVE